MTRFQLAQPAYKRYVLGTLTLVYTLSFIDRSLVVLLLESIKQDLHLTDTQLGFLTGIAFGLFYATLGLPLARWADRGNRVTLTSYAIALWAGTVISCLWVGNFIQLVCARIAAAVGEAGCMPPTYSLLGDYFSAAAERTSAMAVYMLAAPVAALVSFSLGGWLAELYGWRMTFALMGLPGLLFAALVKLTIVEPRVGGLRATTAPVQSLPPMMIVLGTLWRSLSCRHLICGIILLWTLGLGLAPWYGAFLMRSHGASTAELGVWFGLIFGVVGMAGIWLGGYVARRWFSGDERGQMRLSATMIAALFPLFFLFLLLPSKWLSLSALVPMVLLSNFFLGPTFALMQRLVPDEMRATTMAVLMLLANLIGMGLGPQIVGLLSDLLVPALGSDSLRYAMLVMSSLALWASHQFWRAGRSIREEIWGIQNVAERYS